MFTKFDQFRQENPETQLMTVLKAPFGTMVAFLLAVYIYATSAALAQDYPQKPSRSSCQLRRASEPT